MPDPAAWTNRREGIEEARRTRRPPRIGMPRPPLAKAGLPRSICKPALSSLANHRPIALPSCNPVSLIAPRTRMDGQDISAAEAPSLCSHSTASRRLLPGPLAQCTLHRAGRPIIYAPVDERHPCGRLAECCIKTRLIILRATRERLLETSHGLLDSMGPLRDSGPARAAWTKVLDECSSPA
ncbi:MAG: hypothetical protein M1821_001301 [Bathelium mastoideum]|nr:MAG: hypothetical protein M1821_001301 [Bathelium mastoideum]